MRVLQGWGAGDGGRGGGEVPPRGLVSGHGAAVRSPALGQKRSSMIFFFYFSVCFSACKCKDRESERAVFVSDCRRCRAAWTCGRVVPISVVNDY
jgi:hypothetical protein